MAEMRAGTAMLSGSGPPRPYPGRPAEFEWLRRTYTDVAAPETDYLLPEAQKTCRMADDAARGLQTPPPRPRPAPAPPPGAGMPGMLQGHRRRAEERDRRGSRDGVGSRQKGTDPRGGELPRPARASILSYGARDPRELTP